MVAGSPLSWPDHRQAVALQGGELSKGLLFFLDLLGRLAQDSRRAATAAAAAAAASGGPGCPMELHGALRGPLLCPALQSSPEPYRALQSLTETFGGPYRALQRAIADLSFDQKAAPI